MADAGIVQTREQLINEIRALQDELEQLGVTREKIQLYRTPDGDLPEILDSLCEQIKTRKRFLGVN